MVNQSPRITIIMPAYNAQDYISDSIHSVQAQTYDNWELIVVNDGSSDHTSDIVQKFVQQDQRIRFINQKNQGVSVARNTGIEQAKGDFIAFIDSDDEYLPSFLEKLYAKISKNNYDLVYSGVLAERDQYVQGEPYPELNLLLSYTHGIVSYIGFYSALYARDFLNRYNIRFPVGCSLGEDQEFLMHCGIYAKVGSVSEPLYYYRQREDSVIGTMTPHKVRIDLASRQRSTALVQKLYDGEEKENIIRFLQSWEDRIVIIFTNLVIQKIKKGELDKAYEEVIAFGSIPYCWRSKNFKHIKRALILNTKQIWLWKIFWKVKA